MVTRMVGRVSSNLHRRFPSCGKVCRCGIESGHDDSEECDSTSPRKRVLC